jgi:hypothetical protein
VTRTPLSKKGTSDTALIKDEIQDLLRERAIKRDGGCILRPHRMSQAGKIHRGEIALSRGVIAISSTMSCMTRRVASRPIAISSSAR